LVFHGTSKKENKKMSNKLSTFLLAAMLAVVSVMSPAQVSPPQTIGKYGLTPFAFDNQRLASQFNYDIDSLYGSGLGQFQFPQQVCQQALTFGGNQNKDPFNTNATVKIVDITSANTETVALNSKTYTGGLCTLSLANSNSHFTYHLRSGTCGLQEAINDIIGSVVTGTPGFNVVLVDQKFYDDGCTTSTISGIVATATSSNIYIVDLTQNQTWALKATNNTLIAAPGAPTIAVAAGGSLTVGAYLASQECVDFLGNPSLASTDSGSVSTTSGNQTLTFTPSTCGAGSAGYIPQITAAGGAGASEIDAANPLTAAICAQSVLVGSRFACKLGTNATITANPSSTSKQVTFGTAHTAFAYQPVSAAMPVNFQTVYLPFASVSTINSGSNADIAQWYVPSLPFNIFTRSFDVCAKVASTNAATAVPTFKLNVAKNFNQSPVTLATIVVPTQTGAVTTDFCVRVTINATGSSGTIWAGMPSGPLTQTINSTGVSVTAGEVTTAVSSTVDLTGGLYFTINLGAGTANITSVTVNNLHMAPVPTT
jgi:hypothetical protein